MTGAFPDEMSAAELALYRAAAKEALRKRVAALRRSLSAEARADRARDACALLIAQPCFERAQVVLAYAPLRYELDPGGSLERARAAGKIIVLPRVVAESTELALHLYEPGDELQESGFGVREPLPSAALVSAARVDLVLVPGLAFDARGYRLGYGKGFYDRLLPLLPQAQRVGMAFELSLMPEVPNEPHDIPVHCVVTEKRVLVTQDNLR